MDRILTLCSLALRRWEFGRPTYSAFFDLCAIFDCVSHPAVSLAG